MQATLALLLTLLLPGAAMAADYYRWVDRQGTVHFSDSVAGVPPEHRDQLRRGTLQEPEPAMPLPPGDRSAPPPADAAAGEEPARRRFEVPYRPYEGRARRIIVPVTLNGSVTAPMALDTGTPGAVLSARLAARIGVFDDDQARVLVTAGGIGGRTPAVRTILDTVQVGGASDSFVPATVVTTPLSDAFDGLIGMDFMARYRMEVDPARQVLIFEEIPARADAPAGHDEAWWRHTFQEFAGLKNGWRGYAEELEEKRRSPAGLTLADLKELERLQPLAERQQREAERLFDRLNRYAIQHYVPMAWRQH
jgi:hypothetical protein